MNYFALFDLTQPPFGWSQAQFIQAIHILNNLSIDELRCIRAILRGRGFQSSARCLPNELIFYILGTLLPERFFDDAYDETGLIGGLLQQKLLMKNVARY